MSIEVELFAAPGYSRAGRLPLAPFLREAMRAILGDTVEQARFRLSLHRVEDVSVLDGRPRLVNMRPGHGYLTVTVIVDDQVVYRHPHTVGEFVGRPLQQHLATVHPDVDGWGFGLVGPGLEALSLVLPTPELEGQVEITAGRRRGVPRLQEIPDPEPEPIDLAGLGPWPSGPRDGPAEHGGGDGPVVLIEPHTFEQFITQDFSREVEEGGFVIGHHRRDPAGNGRDVLVVTDVVPARSTGASLLRFTFTGESFLQLGSLLAGRQQREQVLGWYHTHLFEATDEFGLSGIDVELHRSTFRRPWQIAALVNLGSSGRVLRFYRFLPLGDAADPAMALIPYRITDAGHAAPGTPR
jgi:proteasome lid subunit RPN8/RPN11